MSRILTAMWVGEQSHCSLGVHYPLSHVELSVPEVQLHFKG